MTIRGIADAWIGSELRVLTENRIPFTLHALTRPRQNYFTAEDIAEMGRNTRIIYPLPVPAAAGNILAAPFRFRGRFFAALWNALTGERETFRSRAVGILHFFVACHWATTLRRETVSHIHSQWIHSAGTVAMYGAWLRGVPFSFTGHAADLFRERAALADKIRRAKFIICISEFHREFYLSEGARTEQLIIGHCGIDTAHFTPRLRSRPEGEPVHIVSSGRLVEKKGFDVLIEACGLLAESGVDFRCTIGGNGPLEEPLRAQIRAAGLEDRISLDGKELKQELIPDFMGEGDIYCLPCVWASDNDVDGLPVMLMEAMACGLPAVSTRLVGIPDLILDGETGLLAESGDVQGLADVLRRLIDDPALARRLAAAGREQVEKEFDLSTCVDRLMEQYRKALKAHA